MKTGAARFKTAALSAGGAEKDVPVSTVTRAAHATLRRARAGRGEMARLDPVIHERTRLSILTAIFTGRAQNCSFSDLRDTLSLTDGNLLTHLRTLEDAGLVELLKEGAGRNSRSANPARRPWRWSSAAPSAA